MHSLLLELSYLIELERRIGSRCLNRSHALVGGQSRNRRLIGHHINGSIA